MFLWYVSAAMAIKICCTMLGTRLVLPNWLSCLNLSVATNARGGPGIVLAGVAYELGIINQTFFAVLVVTAVITSVLAAWWLQFVLSRGWPLLADGPGHASIYPALAKARGSV
jgi:Kef-type K+ transport system membrane component KefB